MPSREAVIDDYLRAPDALAALLDGLIDADLDRARAPGEWTVRQTAHHITEGDLLWTMGLKIAIVHPDTVWRLAWYDSDSWVAALDYARQPLGPALTLFRANRAYVASLLCHLPDDVWERAVRVAWSEMQEPREFTVAQIVAMQAGHALMHIAEIGEKLGR